MTTVNRNIEVTRVAEHEGLNIDRLIEQALAMGDEAEALRLAELLSDDPDPANA